MVRANEHVTNATRDRLLGDVGGFLVTTGLAMRAKGEQERNPQISAVAICTQINGDLAGSQRDLIAERQYYSAAVLGRRSSRQRSSSSTSQATPIGQDSGSQQAMTSFAALVIFALRPFAEPLVQAMPSMASIA